MTATGIVVRNGDHVYAGVKPQPPVVSVAEKTVASIPVVEAKAPIVAVAQQGMGGGGGASAMTQLTDVNLAGLIDGATLKWDSASGFWVPSQTEDYRNFRGDWQPPVDTLLWSTDFTVSEDYDLFVPYATAGGTVSRSLKTTEELTMLTGTPATDYAAFMSSKQGSTWDNGWELPLASVGLAGRYISRVDLWAASAGSASTTRINSALTVSTTPTDWSEHSVEVAQVRDSLSVGVYRAGSSPSVTVEMAFSAFRIYGAASSDLYQRDDVVSHGGSFYRSLYDVNAEQPGAGVRWLLIPPLAP